MKLRRRPTAFARKTSHFVGALFLLATMCLAVLPSPLCSQPSATAGFVEMPPYEVRANRILPLPEKWQYVEVPALVLERGKEAQVAPGYYVISNLNGQNTRLFVRELQLRQLAGMLL